MSDQTSNKAPGGLAGVIRQGITNYMKDVHTALPGKIVEFDGENQTASVQLLIKRVFINDEEKELPQLINVPVWIPRAGGFSITFPVAPNDECLVLFSERSLDNWFKFGGSQPPNDWRMHNLSDAICLVGMASEPNVINGYDTDNFQIRNEADDVYIKIFGEDTKDIELTTGAITIQLDNSSDTVNIVAPTKLVVTTPFATFSGDVNIAGDLDVTGNGAFGGNVDVALNGSYGIDLTVGGNITAVAVIAATVTASGAISGLSLSAGGLDMGSHVHGGVESGTSNTGPPQ